MTPDQRRINGAVGDWCRWRAGDGAAFSLRDVAVYVRLALADEIELDGPSVTVAVVAALLGLPEHVGRVRVHSWGVPPEYRVEAPAGAGSGRTQGSLWGDA